MRPSDDREVVGLIPAAGQARRIAPLPGSKELFPVGFRKVPDGWRPKAVCQHLLEAMRRAGVEKVYFVIREGKWDIPSFLGDGSGMGLHIAYLMMRLPFGSPFTLDQAYPFLHDRIVLLGFPDILFVPEDAYARLLARQRETGAEVVLSLFPADESWRTDMVETDASGRVRRIVVKPPRTDLRFAWVSAAWTPAFSRYLHEYLAGHPPGVGGSDGADRRELYVGDVIQAAVRDGMCVQSVCFPEGEYLDIGTPESLLRAIRRFTPESFPD